MNQNPDIKIFPAMKAFVCFEGKILLLKESSSYDEGTNSGKYDVVGGRVKPLERFDDGLRREVYEETGLEIKIGNPFSVGEWRPIIGDQQLQIVGTFFECFSKSDRVELSRDYDSFEWIDPLKYKDCNLIQNLFPAFESYLKFKSQIQLLS
ncbi:hypothetical protein COU57_01475 [Candidatus Pacearchaeota archaeon CG10_big_fil_rev_8_21_14_0_10_32_14]|nr:MAG: hypothetical protein COU57_01475 [Candidatus Pacearchaeota archaeon CG10_big_fil_rev_8_21_14_0_10_32_14]